MAANQGNAVNDSTSKEKNLIERKLTQQQLVNNQMSQRNVQNIISSNKENN